MAEHTMEMKNKKLKSPMVVADSRLDINNIREKFRMGESFRCSVTPVITTFREIGNLCGGWLETEEETSLKNHLKGARIRGDSSETSKEVKIENDGLIFVIPIWCESPTMVMAREEDRFSLITQRAKKGYEVGEKSPFVCNDKTGHVVTQFLKMETLLDDRVEQKVELQIERGGTPLTLDLLVQDLHSISPDHFLEVSGAVVHPLSYQQARNFRFNCGLVYVSEPGYILLRAGVPRHAIIKKFAGEDISRLEDLISVLSKLSRGARIPLEYTSYNDRHRRKSVLVTIDRHEWYAPPQIYKRDDCSGLWTAKLALPWESPLLVSGIYPVKHDLSKHTGSCTGELSPKDCRPQQVSQESMGGVTSMETSGEHVTEGPTTPDDSDKGINKRKVEENSSADGSVIADCTLNELVEERLDESGSVADVVLSDYQGAAPVAANTSVAERVIERTLVMVEVHVPSSCVLDGVHSQHLFGTGVIVHHSQNMGLVAVDKNTAAVSVSDVMLSFAAFPVEIPGEVVFLHPVHNFALVAYDPSALGVAAASAVHAAELLPGA